MTLFTGKCISRLFTTFLQRDTKVSVQFLFLVMKCRFSSSPARHIVDKEIAKVPVQPSESEKTADTTDAPLSQETEAESGVEKMPEPAYPEPGKVGHAGH